MQRLRSLCEGLPDACLRAQGRSLGPGPSRELHGLPLLPRDLPGPGPRAPWDLSLPEALHRHPGLRDAEQGDLMTSLRGSNYTVGAIHCPEQGDLMTAEGSADHLKRAMEHCPNRVI